MLNVVLIASITGKAQALSNANRTLVSRRVAEEAVTHCCATCLDVGGCIFNVSISTIIIKVFLTLL